MADIFVSYTSSDKLKAFWIGQELIKLGHKPRLHDWEISAGGNIVKWMKDRHQQADHILLVVSKAYLSAKFSSWEQQAAEWAAVDKRPNFALPVFIEECEAETLSAIIKRCDLHGLSEEKARTRLKDYLTPAAPPSKAVPFWSTNVGEPPTRLERRDKIHVQPGSYYAVSNIPIAVPLHFVGRDEVLVDIRSALTRGDGRVAITALHGLRGVGKTTLAAAYADKHRADYRATWWVRAQTNSTMRADLVALGVRLGWVASEEKEEAALGVAKDRLREEGEGILLIFDNANNRDEVRPYLPVSGSAQILVTSNAPNWGGVAAPVQIKVWPKDIGGDFLISRIAGRSIERAAAEELSAALGGLPLAHEQAAAFCERLGISFAEYLKRFAATPATLLDAAKDAPADYHDRMTVAKTFALAIDEAAKLHPAAAPLIEHAALLAPEPIPLFLFAEAREQFGEPLASALAGDGLDEGVAALRAFALIDRESIPDERDPAITTDCIRLHRLVREVAAMRREGEARDGTLCALMEAMAAVYPTDVYSNPATWPRVRRLDAVAVALVESERHLPDGAASFVLNGLAAYRYSALAAYSEATPLYERALAIVESAIGPETPATAIGLNNLADALQAQGNFAAARPLFERALAILEKIDGSESPTIVVYLNNLARVLQEQSDFVVARSLLERAVAIREKVGPEHSITATCLHNLALLLQAQGDLEAARPLFERALAIYEKTSGPENPLTATNLRCLGVLLNVQGNLLAARPLLERALAIFEKVLGLEHVSTWRTASDTADALDALGHDDEARALREKFGIKKIDSRAIKPSPASRPLTSP